MNWNKDMLKEIGQYSESKVDIPLMRLGKKHRIEILINEEAMLLAKYLRDEKILGSTLNTEK
jgi:hypothetical protein